MAFFTSEHECKLDAKGRLVLPSRLKSVLPEASKKSIIIRKGFEPNLIIYPLHEFQNIYTRINSLNDCGFTISSTFKPSDFPHTTCCFPRVTKVSPTSPSR